MSSRMADGRWLRAGILALAMIAAGAGSAAAATLASGPLRIGDLQNYSCTAVNVSGRALAVEVEVVIGGGGFGASQSCTPLGAESVCNATNDAGFAAYRFCTITTSSKKGVRGTFCNNTTGACVPVE